MGAPEARHHRRFQAGFPLIALSEFRQPPLIWTFPPSKSIVGIMPPFAVTLGKSRFLAIVDHRLSGFQISDNVH
jgi:hypothetical protein